MIKNYWEFSSRNWQHLTFGAMLLAISSFGQTYFISISGAHFRDAFRLSDGGLGTVYAIGTFLSAVTLTWAGRLIDYTTVRAFSWAVAVLLACACGLVSFSPNVYVLLLAFYLLRLGGQGLMVHTALTATARTFPADAGKALGIIALGMSVAQATFPLAGVTMNDTFGWRASWAINALFVIAAVGVALAVLPRAGDRPLRQRRPKGQASTEPRRASLLLDRRLLMTLPAVLASPFIVTGFFFHQGRLAEQKHWDITWLAAGFVVFAIVQAVSVVVIGPVIDRFGTKRILPYFLLPQAIGMLALGLLSSSWVALVYMVLMGISSAFGSTLATALWVELFGANELARVRSAVEAGSVIASGASPVIMGLLIDAGFPLSWQALACCAYTVLASIIAIGVQRVKV
ncbi:MULTISPECIES: MFS transporter [Rhizobium/Agrobacterium group]|uniref:MFS transporter n=1 Tax=Rhizobium/Agrobacterium group TaxID=227290 RepID=UPI000B3F8DC4|nr:MULTISPECIES: MFS transporter [Rhizobium/Agrobacterium group]MCF1480749.1 MFS transporter [Allorhizobium ampelinum]NSZ44601.1 MFS transporter [Agrobacterium vitis]NTA28348.1 MFS transporter [Allorhizobium ampelinum]OVE92981.1 MFS transporter [Allorhizobium ampelinum]